MQRLWNRMATLMLYLGIDTILVLNDAIHTLAPYLITNDETNNVEDNLTETLNMSIHAGGCKDVLKSILSWCILTTKCSESIQEE